MTVTVLRRARRDIDHILEWIGKRSRPGAARWHAALQEAVAGLREDPTRFALAPESEDLGQPVRERLFKTRRGRVYRLLFLVVGSDVRILRVRGPGQAPLTEDEIRD